MIDLDSLSVPEAKLIQHGLRTLGFYDGTTKGLPGPKTKAAYDRFLKSFDEIEAPGSDNIGPLLISTLRSKIGVREIPKNSNRGADVEEFQRATWLNGTGWPWCAAFICWGIQKVEEEIDLPFKRPETAAAWGFEQWARDEGVKLFKPRHKIKAGDIVMFTFSHIGLAIEDEKGGKVKTIEGNTDSSGSREGGGVYEKIRDVDSIRSHVRLELAA